MNKKPADQTEIFPEIKQKQLRHKLHWTESHMNHLLAELEQTLEQLV